jgi:competence protein ComEC
VLVAFAALLNALVWYAVLRERPHDLKVSVLDIGQGDAILIESPTGNQMLIDGGGTREVLQRLGEEMPFYDHSIDVVMETHPDKDHIGGLPLVLSAYQVGAFMEPGIESDTKIDDELEKDVDADHVHRVIARRGMVVHLGGGADLSILFPDRDMSGYETNEASIVAKLQYGATSFLLTGDSPSNIENYLIGLDGEGLKSDVLKVGHHGSKYSTSLLFAKEVDPEFAAISVGKDNSYGHPSQEALNNLAAVGAQIDETENEGTIHFLSDGKTVIKE